MRFLSLIGSRASRLLWRVLSIPLFFKIMGIGVVVAFVFGSITLLQISGSVSQALYGLQESRSWSLSRALAAGIERPMTTGDLLSVKEEIHQARRLFPDIRYVIVRNARGQVVSHTFQRSVPNDLLETNGVRPGFRVLSSREGLLFDASSAAIIAHCAACVSLPPKAPPMRRTSTVTALLGRPSAWAVRCWSSEGCWQEEWISKSPFSIGTTIEAWPSR